VVGDRLHVEAELPVTAVAEGEHLALIAHHGSVILTAAHLKILIQPLQKLMTKIHMMCKRNDTK
jgi:hypothetical protein